MNGLTPESVAAAFHETYERLAPSFGYDTRQASAVPWEDVPEPNKSLMVAVAGEVTEHIRELIAQDVDLMSSMRLPEVDDLDNACRRATLDHVADRIRHPEKYSGVAKAPP